MYKSPSQIKMYKSPVEYRRYKSPVENQWYKSPLKIQGYQKITHPSETEVIEPDPLTLEFELILEMEEVGLKCLSYGELGVKNADLVSFKNSNKYSSFIFFERSPALDSSFEPDSVLVPSSISYYEDMESLGANNLGSASAVESAKASLAPKDVGPPAACYASLCISPTTGVGVLDSDVCFEDWFLLSSLLAPGFFPWGTSSACEEGFGALESTGTSSGLHVGSEGRKPMVDLVELLLVMDVPR
ncbi:hypothetical protein Tco_0537870 [Tanacetum coccineum]